MDTPSLWKCVAALSAFLVSCSRITNVHGSAVMSVDISSEWMRVVALSSSVPMERAISNEFMGKIATAIAFDNGERLIGEDALESGVYRPSDCYVYFLDLIGKTMDNPVVELYKKRFPQYNIVPHAKRNTVLFKRSDSDEHFSPEDLVAMLLEEAKDLAKYLTKEDVNEAVISVPSYFGQSERFGMILAAKIAGIEVMHLINSCTAAALNYGTLHTDKFYKTTPVHMMFFDMDSYGTQASIVSYQLVNSEDKTVTELPQLTVLGVGYERSLGGLEIQLRLRDYLASRFNSLKLTSKDVTKDPKSMARLFIEAGRLKGALSTNTEHLVRVKSLIDKKDLEINVTREELNELCYDIFDQVVFTAQKALKSSRLTTELIEEVIFVGTAIEVPRVQERLVKDLGLSRSLNTDGAVVLGAAYEAADCIRSYRNGFEVKPFITNDATLFPAQVTFDDKVFDDNKPRKQVKRIFFDHMNPYPQHHLVTFYKQQRDIAFSMSYAELNHFDQNEIRSLGSLSLAKFKTKGIQEAYIKYQRLKAVDIRGIEVCFSIDHSGLLVAPKVNLLVEKTVTEDKTNSVSDSKNLRVITVKEPIRVYTSEISFMNIIHDDELQSLINKLKKIKNIDIAIARKRKSLHNLLEAIYDTHLKLNKPEYVIALTDTEKKTILDKRIELSNWLARGGTDAEVRELDFEYDELKKLVMPVWTRVSEHSERPLKLEALNNALDRSNLLLKEIKMTPLDDASFTQIEIDAFEKLIVETTSWRDVQIEKQEKLPKNVDPVLRIENIEVYCSSLEIEMSKFTSLKLKIKEALQKTKNPNAETPKFETADEKAKMIEEHDIDANVKTKISQDDNVIELNKNEGIINVVDDVDLNIQIKAHETWLGWLPHLIVKTSQTDEL